MIDILIRKHLYIVTRYVGSSLPDGYHKDAEIQEAIEVYSKLYEESKRRGKGKGKGKESSLMDVDQETPTEEEPKIKGYMTSDIFLEWLQRFQQSIVSKDPSRRILMLVDNVSSHTKNIVQKAHLFPNIKVQFLPPNSTSVTQPLDAGIMAVFKLRYRQIIADKTVLLRLTYDRAKKGRNGVPVNPWNLKISNLEAWNSIVRAWSYVKPESIRNCYRHVPILCDEQKNQLRQFNGIEDVGTIDPCVYEAIVSRRDIDDLVDSQVGSDAESTLEIPYQYTGMPSSSSSASSGEERTEYLRSEMAREILFRSAMPALVRTTEETLEVARDLRVQVERLNWSNQAMEPSEGLPSSETLPRTRSEVRGAFISANSQRIIISDEERNRATTIQAAIDGAPFLCKFIDDYSGNEAFMSYFKPVPAKSETATLLGEEWFPSDDDMSDGDFLTSSDTESSDSMDSAIEVLESDEEGQASDEQDLHNVDYGHTHSILMQAARALKKEHSHLTERLELIADAGLSPDFFDADAAYVSQFEESQRQQGETHRQIFAHGARLKEKYPQVKFPVMTLGTIECFEGDMEISNGSIL